MIKFDKYAITADANCYTAGELKKSIDKKTGEEREHIASAGYYSTLQSAMRGILQKEQRRIVRENELTLHEAISQFEALQERFRQYLSVIQEEI